MKNKTIDDYLTESKYDLILYVIITVILIIANIIIYAFFTAGAFMILMFLSIFHFSNTLGKMNTYTNIIKIKKFIETKNLSIGKIIFWNELDYFLTDKYMIIIRHKIVDYFNYDEIEEIYKETKVRKSGRNIHIYELLHIILIDERDYSILTWDLNLNNQEIKDITDFLLKKNPKIKDITNEKIEEKEMNIKNIIINFIRRIIGMFLLVISIIFLKDFINLKNICYLLLSIIFFIFTVMMYPTTSRYLKKWILYKKNKKLIIIILIINIIILLCMLPE